jgi:uncharacterized membrane protein
MKKKFSFLTIAIYAVLIGLIIFAIVSIFNMNSQEKVYSYNDMITVFEENQVYGYEANINEYTVYLFNTGVLTTVYD